MLKRASRLTLLNCSSCSVSSSTACVCFCLISWTWASCDRVSSSRAFFSTVTSCSLLALDRRAQWVGAVGRRSHRGRGRARDPELPSPPPPLPGRVTPGGSPNLSGPASSSAADSVLPASALWGWTNQYVKLYCCENYKMNCKMFLKYY